MSSLNGSSKGNQSDDEPMAARLRALEWPEAPAEVRERCWERIRERLGELHVQRENGHGPVTHIDIDRAERHGFSRQPVHRRLTPVEGWSSRDKRTGAGRLSTSTGARVESMLRAAGARAA